jgi:Cu-Zn family superoxide dismutase
MQPFGSYTTGKVEATQQHDREEKMNMKRTAFVAGALLLFSAIAHSQASAQTAEVELLNSKGKTVGRATLTEQQGGVRISLEAWKLSPGPHGFHIHAVGRCNPPDFTSASSHFNPDGKKHGVKNSAGAHAGDLPNLVIGPDGTAAVEVMASQVTFRPGINSLFGRNGSALVIHANPDDDQTDPAGNAGARIACGVISSR